MVILLAFFLIAWSFPIYLNLFKGKELDAYCESDVGLQEGQVDPDSRTGSISVPRDEKDLETAKIEKRDDF